MLYDETQQFTTPVGRLVQGDCFTPQTTDRNGQPLTTKDGRPKQLYFMAIAIPKTDPKYTETEAVIKGVAQRAWPNLFDPDGNPLRPDFALKIVDGDSTVPNKAGVPPCQREGFAGHWVVKFTSGYAPSSYRFDTATQRYVQLDAAGAIKRGDYIQVSGTVKSNEYAQSPGVFLNCTSVLFVGHGPAIETEGAHRMDPTAAFGGQAPVLPPGASATPIAPQTTAAPPQAQPGVQATPRAGVQYPSAQVQPDHTFVQGHTGAQPQVQQYPGSNMPF